MLDEASGGSATAEDLSRLVYWRTFALEKQERYEEALDLLRKSAPLFNCQSHVRQQAACLLVRLGRDQEALSEMSKAPIESEMASFYGLAIDAKFFYFQLLATEGDNSVKDRLSEIPDDYEHITMDGKLLTKADLVALSTEP